MVRLFSLVLMLMLSGCADHPGARLSWFQRENFNSEMALPLLRRSSVSLDAETRRGFFDMGSDSDQ